MLEEGDNIYCGCIGGHGRTGMYLSALQRIINGDTNATDWVRANYCKKAVETPSQIEFLYKEYGIAKVKPVFAPTRKKANSVVNLKMSQTKLPLK